MVVTGATEHVGRHLRDALRADYRVFCIGNCTRESCGAPGHPNITWFEADLADRAAIEEVFRRIEESGGVDLIIYLTLAQDDAATPDLERKRINEEGLRNVLELGKALGPQRFVVASPEEKSLAPSSGSSEIAAILDRSNPGIPTSHIRFAERPRLLLIGASGFIGRHLIDVAKEDFRVLGVARTSQQACGVPVHPNISWHQLDIGDAESVRAVFRKIREDGDVDLVVHLAAYYDFTGETHAEYRRTNVVGLRNVLDACRDLKPRAFLFASSVAACEFPSAGAALTESSAADGSHPYAVSKRIGEQMLAEYQDAFPSVIIRLGAVFSDWCEYPPVFVALERWRSKAWDRRILGGRGTFAIPYLHVRDVETFFRRVIGCASDLGPSEVLIASTDRPVTLRDLYGRVTWYYFGDQGRSLYLPKAVCVPGMYARDLVGRLLGRRPFERPWMGGYIDRQMCVDARHTRSRLGWSPRERFELLRRMPFLVENLKRNPVEWHHRNQAVMRRRRTAANLQIHRLLEQHERGIIARLEAGLSGPGGEPTLRRHAALPASERNWTHRAALHQLANAVRTLDMGVYLTFCRDLAERRYADGFTAQEICAVLRALSDSCVEVLTEDGDAEPLGAEIRERIAMTTMFGSDHVEESFDDLLGAQVRREQRLAQV
jgi:nucleoside-diphosphate-sugar epimerase